MKNSTPKIRNVGMKLKTEIGTLREKNHSALSAFCDLRVLASIVICLAGLTLAAFAVAPSKYSAGNTITVITPNGTAAVKNLADGDLRTKPDRIGVPLQGPGWVPTGSLVTARGRHTATLLPGGTVLVAGGQNNGGYLSTAELYEATRSWSRYLAASEPRA